MKIDSKVNWKTLGYRVLRRMTPNGERYRYRGLDRFCISEIVVTHEWQEVMVPREPMLVNVSGCTCTHPESGLGKILRRFKIGDLEALSDLKSAYSFYEAVKPLNLEFELVAYEANQANPLFPGKDESEGWPILGFDVVDIVGFFSILNDVVVQKQSGMRNIEYKFLFTKFHPALNNYGLLSTFELGKDFFSCYSKLPNPEVLDQTVISRVRICPEEMREGDFIHA